MDRQKALDALKLIEEGESKMTSAVKLLYGDDEELDKRLVSCSFDFAMLRIRVKEMTKGWEID